METEFNKLADMFTGLGVPFAKAEYTRSSSIVMDTLNERKGSMDCWVEFQFGEAGQFQHMGVYTRDSHGPFELIKRNEPEPKPDTSFDVAPAPVPENDFSYLTPKKKHPAPPPIPEHQEMTDLFTEFKKGK